MDSIITFLNHPAATAIVGFVGGFIAQFLLRSQISKHEIKKDKIEYSKTKLENLKQYAEQLIAQIMAYDELANHIIVTLNYSIHDEKSLSKLSQKIKKINDELSPKLQVHFYDLASYQNEYTKAVRDFQNSFFQGLKYEGIKQRGWTKEDIDRMHEELKELSKQKFNLISETIKYINEKEDCLYKD